MHYTSPMGLQEKSSQVCDRWSECLEKQAAHNTTFLTDESYLSISLMTLYYAKQQTTYWGDPLPARGSTEPGKSGAGQTITCWGRSWDPWIAGHPPTSGWQFLPQWKSVLLSWWWLRTEETMRNYFVTTVHCSSLMVPILSLQHFMWHVKEWLVQGHSVSVVAEQGLISLVQHFSHQH